ncbi:MAG: LysE family translocator [Candidatus Wallbacteria bacterium]|nr:LysE family translocator [Candidatus Wallbacteria bacterium]
MLTLQVALTFFAASIALALAPGPDNIFVLTQSSLSGRKAGILITLGLCTGILVHSSAVALGVAVFFQRSRAAFFILKSLGACYLGYLAFQAFRAADAELSSGTAVDAAPFKLYCRGIIMNVTNPKVSIFFLAFLPQFADPQRGSVPVQLMMLGSLFILATILIFSAIALLAGTLGQWLNRSRIAQKVMHRVAGTVFACIAVKLATAVR